MPPAPRRGRPSAAATVGSSAASRVRQLTRELGDINGRLRVRQREYELERREAAELSQRAVALSDRLSRVRDKLRLAFALVRSGPQRGDIAALAAAAQGDERAMRRLAAAMGPDGQPDPRLAVAVYAPPRPLTPIRDDDDYFMDTSSSGGGSGGSDYGAGALPGLGIGDDVEGPAARRLPDFGDGWDEAAAAAGGAPEEFLCPITCALMRDPVQTSDGHRYERVAIEEWIGSFAAQADEPRSPLTNLPLANTHLVPDGALQRRIAAWVAERLPEVSRRCPAAPASTPGRGPAAASETGTTRTDEQVARQLQRELFTEEAPEPSSAPDTDADLQSLMRRLMPNRESGTDGPPRRYWSSSAVPARERSALAPALRRLASMEAQTRLGSAEEDDAPLLASTCVSGARGGAGYAGAPSRQRAPVPPARPGAEAAGGGLSAATRLGRRNSTPVAESGDADATRRAARTTAPQRGTTRSLNSRMSPAVRR